MTKEEIREMEIIAEVWSINTKLKYADVSSFQAGYTQAMEKVSAFREENEKLRAKLESKMEGE